MDDELPSAFYETASLIMLVKAKGCDYPHCNLICLAVIFYLNKKEGDGIYISKHLLNAC